MLRTENDSLKTVLQVNTTVMSTLQEVGAMIDSIDASRQKIKMELVEGISEENYTARLQAIHKHVRRSEDKIKQLEESMKELKTNESFYMDMIAALKDDLDLRLQ